MIFDFFSLPPVYALFLISLFSVLLAILPGYYLGIYIFVGANKYRKGIGEFIVRVASLPPVPIIAFYYIRNIEILPISSFHFIILLTIVLIPIFALRTIDLLEQFPDSVLNSGIALGFSITARIELIRKSSARVLLKVFVELLPRAVFYSILFITILSFYYFEVIKTDVFLVEWFGKSLGLHTLYSALQMVMGLFILEWLIIFIIKKTKAL